MWLRHMERFLSTLFATVLLAGCGSEERASNTSPLNTISVEELAPKSKPPPSEPEPEPELASGLAAVVSTDRCVVMIEEDVQLKAYNPYDDLLG